MAHLKQVIEVTESFDRDIRGGDGYLDAMRSYTWFRQSSGLETSLLDKEVCIAECSTKFTTAFLLCLYDLVSRFCNLCVCQALVIKTIVLFAPLFNCGGSGTFALYTGKDWTRSEFFWEEMNWTCLSTYSISSQLSQILIIYEHTLFSLLLSWSDKELTLITCLQKIFNRNLHWGVRIDWCRINHRDVSRNIGAPN